MQATKTSNPRESADVPQPKPYHQLPDEPDKWYQNFEHFCEMGPSRDLQECYREVMALRDPKSASGPPKKVSPAWRQKYREFDWEARAKAWDEDRRELAVKQAEGLLNNIMDATMDALQILIDMMNGVVKDADGNLILVVDPYQIRMAAKTVLSKGLEAIPLLMAAQSGERPEISISNIFAHQPGGRLTPGLIEGKDDFRTGVSDSLSTQK